MEHTLTDHETNNRLRAVIRQGFQLASNPIVTKHGLTGYLIPQAEIEELHRSLAACLDLLPEPQIQQAQKQ